MSEPDEAAVLDAIRSVAPDADLDAVDRTADLRDEIDIDSMDFLNILVRIEEATGVAVPESDYARVTSLQALVDYVAERA